MMADAAENDYETWGTEIHVWSGINEFVNISTLDNGIHRISLDAGPSLDLLVEGIEKLQGWERIPVFFNGAVAQRPTKKGPFFSGRGLASGGNYGFAAFSDPSTSLDVSLGLAWYAGNHRSDLEDPILQSLKSIKRLFGKDLLLIGGSGGGFAAIRFASLLGDSAAAMVWNPQSDILNYNEDAVKNYLSAAFPDGATQFVNSSTWRAQAEAFLEAKNVRHELFSLPNRPKNLVVLQNASDWHVSAHLAPLARAWGLSETGYGVHSDGRGVFVLVSNYGDGHASPPVGSLQMAIESMGKYGKSASETIIDLQSRPELFTGDQMLLPTDLSKKSAEILGDIRISVDLLPSDVAEASVEHNRLLPNFGGLSYSFFVVGKDGNERPEVYGRSRSRRLDLHDGDTAIGVRLRDGFGGEVGDIRHPLVERN